MSSEDRGLETLASMFFVFYEALFSRSSVLNLRDLHRWYDS